MSLDEGLGRRFGAGTEDLHDIIARLLPGIPATTGRRLGRRLLCRFRRRLGGCNLGWRRLGHRCNRLAGNWRYRLLNRCNRLCRSNRLCWRWRRASGDTRWRCNRGDGRRLQSGFASRRGFFAFTHAGGLGQRATHDRLRLAYQRQGHRLRVAGEFDRRAAIVRLGIAWLTFAQWQLRLLGRGSRRLVTLLRHQHGGRNGDHNDCRQRQHMFLRHIEPH
ncbi:hypothetical protein D3C79_803770 [compost metagenome]